MEPMHERMDDLLTEGGADWTLIRAFVEVVRAGTLSAAARNLQATQPTLGRQIRRLETLSGEPLFQRTGRELKPTDRALQLYDAASQIEVEVTALSRAFASGARGPGLVRITTSEVFASQVLPELLAPLLAEDADLEVEIMASDRMENLVRRDADIAIRFTPPTQPELIASKLGEVELCMYCAPALLDRMGEPRDLADLMHWPWVASTTHTEVMDAFASRGLRLDPSRIRVRSNSIPARLAAMEAGLGVGGMARGVAERCRLTPLFGGKVVASFGAWIVANDDIRRTPRLRFVHDRLRSMIRERMSQMAADPSALPIPFGAASR